MGRVVDFAGTTAVVTGGASGIGRGIAGALLAEGCHVIIADIDDAALAATAKELGVLGVRTDVTSAESVQALADTAVAEYGSVHVICNNAGVGPKGPIAELTLADWGWIIQVNLFGVIHGVQSFLPILEKNKDWGHVVNTSSMSVLAPPANLAAYVASKAGVLGLTEVLAKELEQGGSFVGTTALMPGPVHTNIAHSLRTRPDYGPSSLYDVDIAGNGKNYRFLEPEEIGKIVVSAIRTNQLYATTHAEWLPPVTERHLHIQSEFPVGIPA